VSGGGFGACGFKKYNVPAPITTIPAKIKPILSGFVSLISFSFDRMLCLVSCGGVGGVSVVSAEVILSVLLGLGICVSMGKVYQSSFALTMVLFAESWTFLVPSQNNNLNFVVS